MTSLRRPKIASTLILISLIAVSALGCGGKGALPSPQIATLVSIAVTPPNSKTVISMPEQFAAAGTYSDGSQHDLTSAVAWSSLIPSVATITTAGLASPSGNLGSTIISASLEGFSGSTLMTVLTSKQGFDLTAGGVGGSTATLLDDGRVLYTGGGPYGVTAVASYYEPIFRGGSQTGNMGVARSEGHTASLLNNGKVLIAGGLTDPRLPHGLLRPLPSTEIYDPAKGSFAPTADMTIARVMHTATVLNDGRILIVGGYAEDTTYAPLSSAELYDPSAGVFTPTANMNVPRFFHTATLLNDGRVLIVGGSRSGAAASAELYDPTSGTFSLTGAPSVARERHSATLLNNGTVLLAGGDPPTKTVTAELYNPATGTFALTGNLTVPRTAHAATLLNNGQVLLVGSDQLYLGADLALGPTTAELYDPATGTFVSVGNTVFSHLNPLATLLNNGLVFIGPELFEPLTFTPPGLVSIHIAALPTIAPLASQRLVATGLFSDNSTQVLSSVTWSSSNPAIAIVSNDVTNKGVAFGLTAGTITIAAAAGSISGSVNLTVAPQRTAGLGLKRVLSPQKGFAGLLTNYPHRTSSSLREPFEFRGPSN